MKHNFNRNEFENTIAFISKHSPYTHLRGEADYIRERLTTVIIEMLSTQAHPGSSVSACGFTVSWAQPNDLFHLSIKEILSTSGLIKCI